MLTVKNSLGKPDARDSKNVRNSLVPQKNGEEEFDNLVPDVAQYGRVQFWDDRYLVESEPFEWYHPYDYYRDAIMDSIKLESKVMVAGCGTSNMPEDLVADGYQNVTAQDISRIAIEQQKVRCKHLSENIKCITGNMTDMDMEEETVDAIIDKALLDSLYCSAMGETAVAQYINEVIRLLSPEGVFFVVSYMPPEDCLPMLEQFDIDEPYYTPWIIEVQAMLKPKQFEDEIMDPDDPSHLYWVYIARKNDVMVTLKKTKENKLKLKAKKAKKKKATTKAPNL
jgi:EEF1A lysine methyltransferase 4